MFSPTNAVFKTAHRIQRVQLLSLHSPPYRQFLQNILNSRPSQSGHRNEGEHIGRIVERAARHLLSQQVTLDSRRILQWQQEGGGFRYRELDAVWRIDYETLAVFEIKLAPPHAMQRAIGISQLNAASEVLRIGHNCKRVCRRLVYVADEALMVGQHPGIEAVSAGDVRSDIGIIWFVPGEVELAAAALGLSLPPKWFDPATRRPCDAPIPAEDTLALEPVPWNSFATAMKRAKAQTERADTAFGLSSQTRQPGPRLS